MKGRTRTLRHSCGRTLPLDAFSSNVHNADGLEIICRDCVIAEQSAWRGCNPGRKAAHAKTWDDANRDRKRAASREYYRRNRGRLVDDERRRRAERKRRERLDKLRDLAEREQAAREAALAAAAEFRAAVVEARAAGGTLREIGEAAGRSKARIHQIVQAARDAAAGDI